MSDARAITAALGGKWAGQYGLACCPVHGDRTASLKIKDDPRKSDGIDVHCFAGCDWQHVKADLARDGLLSGFAPGAELPRKSFDPVVDTSANRELAAAAVAGGPATHREHARLVLFRRASRAARERARRSIPCAPLAR
jgi:hypothetical protein